MAFFSIEVPLTVNSLQRRMEVFLPACCVEKRLSCPNFFIFVGVDVGNTPMVPVQTLKGPHRITGKSSLMI